MDLATFKKNIIFFSICILVLIIGVIFYQNTKTYEFPKQVKTEDIQITNINLLDDILPSTTNQETKDIIARYAGENGFGEFGELSIKDEKILNLPGSYRFFITTKSNMDKFRVDIIIGKFDDTLVYINGVKQRPINFIPAE